MNGRQRPAAFTAKVEAILRAIREQHAAIDPGAFPQRRADGTCFYCLEPARPATGAYCADHGALMHSGRGLETR